VANQGYQERSKPIVNSERKAAPEFRKAPLVWAVALLPNVSKLPGSTPILWTRGLQADGTWGEARPFRTTPGSIFFADGRMRSFQGSIKEELKAWGTGKPTSNIREALPPGTRISEWVPSPEQLRRVTQLRRQERWQDWLRLTIPPLLLVGCSFWATAPGLRSLGRGICLGLFGRAVALVVGLICAIIFCSEVSRLLT
jgi:hypothetical protein